MAVKELIPVLEAVYNRDQWRLRDLQIRIDQLRERIADLASPALDPGNSADAIQLVCLQEKHLQWRRQEAARLAACIDDLGPQLDSAQAALKISFGKLEVAKKLAKAER